MSNVISMSFNSPRPMNMNPVQRSVYFTLGLGIIIAGMAADPMSTMSMAFLNIVGIALVTTAIIGQGLRLSKLRIKGRRIGSVVQPLTSAILGIAIATSALLLPGLTPAWMAVAQTAAVILILSALLNMEFILTDKKHKNIESLTIEQNEEWVVRDAA